MCNEYAYKLAKALVWPELTPEFAADVINGNIFGSDIWDEVCTMIGGWCFALIIGCTLVGTG